MRCCIFGCNNSNQGANATTAIIYHSFPKDLTIRKQWLDLCGSHHYINPNTARMCSVHFVEDDYSPDPFLILYGIKNKRRKLKNGVVPTQHLPRRQSARLNFFTRRNKNKTKNEIESLEPPLMNILETNNVFAIHQSASTSSIENRRQKKLQKLHAIPVDLQEPETSEPSFDIKQEITIDEPVLEDYIHFPKLETFENSTAGTSDEPNPLLEVENQTSQESALENHIYFPISETFENSTAGTSNEPNPFLEVDIQTLQVTNNISSSTSSKSFTKRRKEIENDKRIEGHNFLDTVQVKLENEEDHVEYGMYIASRLQNANQSDRAIAMAKHKIELILSDLEMGIFEMSLH